MQPATVISIKDFDFSYGKKPVYRGFSLDIKSGRIHGFLGANGAGKSTLFNCIFHHEKYGAITTAEGFEKELAYLQTEPYFYPYMTGMEYLKIVCQPRKHSGIEQWNEVFQLPLGDYVHNYSTGMKKKIALLGNILLNKKILLLDEPTNGLDLETNEFFKLLVHRLKDHGITILVSSHILEVLFSICDAITLLGGHDKANTYSRAEFEQLKAAVQTGYGNKQQAVLDKLLPL